MKLQSMTDFVLQQEQNCEFHVDNTVIETGKLAQRIFKYAKFLKQPLTLGMFVPVDDNGIILTEPFYDPANEQYWAAERFAYDSTKERVLFEGFKIEEGILGPLAIRKNGWVIFKCSKSVGSKWENTNSFPDIESLISLDIELTPSAIKRYKL